RIADPRLRSWLARARCYSGRALATGSRQEQQERGDQQGPRPAHADPFPRQLLLRVASGFEQRRSLAAADTGRLRRDLAQSFGQLLGRSVAHDRIALEALGDDLSQLCWNAIRDRHRWRAALVDDKCDHLGQGGAAEGWIARKQLVQNNTE